MGWWGWLAWALTLPLGKHRGLLGPAQLVQREAEGAQGVYLFIDLAH